MGLLTRRDDELGARNAQATSGLAVLGYAHADAVAELFDGVYWADVGGGALVATGVAAILVRARAKMGRKSGESSSSSSSSSSEERQRKKVQMLPPPFFK